MQPAPRVHQKRWLAWTALAVVHVGIAIFYMSDRAPGTDAALTGLPLDDAWIHLVYGRSVAESGAPYYNDYELEAGFTSPAWVIVCAAAHWLSALPGIDVALALKILGVLCAVTMSWAVCELTLVFGGGELGGLLAGLLCALTPALAFSQVSGMEVCLAASFGLWALAATYRRRPMTAGVLLALAFWARPEMLVLGAVIIVARLRELLDEPNRANLKAALKAALPVLALGGLWSAYCLAATGRVLPNTFYAKFSSGNPIGFITIVREVLWPLPVNASLAGVTLYAVGLFRLIRQPGSTPWVALFFSWIFIAAIAVSRQIPPGSAKYYYWLRYVLPALPFFYPVIAVGWRALWGAGPKTTTEQIDESASPESSGSASTLLWGRRTVALIVVAWCFSAYPGALRESADHYAWNCQNINEVQVALGKWVAANTSDDETIIVNDAGALRYFGNRRTIDLMGLNRHALAQNRRRLLGAIASPFAMREFMAETESDYLILFPGIFTGVCGDPRSDWVFESVADARSENYTIADGPQDLMAVYRLRQRD